MKHSQGPWTAWIGGNYGAGITGPAAAASLVARCALDDINKCDAEWLKRCEPYHYIVVSAFDQTSPCLVFGDTEEQTLANAKLIEKAPEMLGLLSSLAASNHCHVMLPGFDEKLDQIMRDLGVKL